MDCEKSYFQLFSLDAALGYTIMGCLSTNSILFGILYFPFVRLLLLSDSFPAYQMSDDLSLKTMHSQLDRILNGYWVVKCRDPYNSIQTVSLLMSNPHLHPLLPQIHLPPLLGETQVAVLNRAHLVLQQVLLSH